MRRPIPPTRAVPFTTSLLVAVMVSVLPAPSSAQSEGPEAAVAAFHSALARGDSAAAAALLADDLTVAESGNLETREEYLAHHLRGDMAFAASVEREAGEPRTTVSGDVAWVVSTSRTRGEYRGRSIDSAGAELVVLSRSGGVWLIRAIHWSSRSAR